MAEIRAFIAEIRPKTSENVLKNWVNRIDYCQANRGEHLTAIMLHIYLWNMNTPLKWKGNHWKILFQFLNGPTCT